MTGKRGNCEKVGIWAKLGEFGVKSAFSRRLAEIPTKGSFSLGKIQSDFSLRTVERLAMRLG